MWPMQCDGSRSLPNSSFLALFDQGVGEIARNLYLINGNLGSFRAQLRGNPETPPVNLKSVFELNMMPTLQLAERIISWAGALAQYIDRIGEEPRYPAVVRSTWLTCIATILGLMKGIKDSINETLRTPYQDDSFYGYADRVPSTQALITQAGFACVELSKNVNLASSSPEKGSEDATNLEKRIYQMIESSRQLKLLKGIDDQSFREIGTKVSQIAQSIR